MTMYLLPHTSCSQMLHAAIQMPLLCVRIMLFLTPLLFLSLSSSSSDILFNDVQPGKGAHEIVPLSEPLNRPSMMHVLNFMAEICVQSHAVPCLDCCIANGVSMLLSPFVPSSADNM